MSHEEIYQSIYVQGRGAVRRELAFCLRNGRALRTRRAEQGQRRDKAAGVVWISERPAEVQDRAVPGHWESDLIMGRSDKSAIGTLVERFTRFVLLLHLPDGRDIDQMAAAMTQAMRVLPDVVRRSLSMSHRELATLKARVAVAADAEIYFCDPKSPWKPGSNESTNGLLRQYFPKGTNLAVHGEAELDRVAVQLNSRPRQTLDWRTPAEALAEVLNAAAGLNGQ